MNRISTFAAGLFVIVVLGYLLIVGRSLLMPVVIALLIWNLLHTLNQAMRRIPWLGARLPHALTMMLSLAVIVAFILCVVHIVSNNLTDVIGASARYQDNFKHMAARIDQQDLARVLSGFDQFIKKLDIQGILLGFYGVFTTIAGSAVLIALYVVFLFVEQKVVPLKLNRLFHSTAHREVINHVLTRVGKDIQAYLGLKTMMGLLTAGSSWAIMRLAGLDFAEFWALLIFFLNYIPNIGAIIATLFPAVLALIQFQNIFLFTMMTSGLVLVQFVIGNLIEPRFLSRSLNLSPLIILFALALWGAIWGVLGMFLSVPITVMMMIVFSHFPSTRPMAIILSQNGAIKTA